MLKKRLCVSSALGLWALPLPVSESGEGRKEGSSTAMSEAGGGGKEGRKKHCNGRGWGWGKRMKEKHCNGRRRWCGKRWKEEAQQCQRLEVGEMKEGRSIAMSESGGGGDNIVRKRTTEGYHSALCGLQNTCGGHGEPRGQGTQSGSRLHMQDHACMLT